MLNFDPNQVVIYALVFVLGLLVGGFLFTGGGRKWKGRYNAEVDRRKELEVRHVAAEKDWREQDSLRNAAARDAERKRPVAADSRDTDRDGVVSANEAAVSPVISDSRDTNRDGVVDAEEAARPEGGLLRRKPDRNNDGDRPAGGFMDKVLGRDRDRDADGVPDRKE